MPHEIQLTDAQIDEIAEKAAERAFQKIYQNVGKSVLTKLTWMVGAAVVGLFMWLGGNGTLPK
jgi:tetrahydromethanopterin S-methyltransferase subunit G|tara:strand:+ start:125 stop:313 length:189 start_codon:yes stop_codon:yes gene_type:complete